jgi:hypothetical protein
LTDINNRETHDRTSSYHSNNIKNIGGYNMSQKFVLASVGTAQFFDQTSGDLIVSSKTLVDSGINFSVTAEEIRGGN